MYSGGTTNAPISDADIAAIKAAGITCVKLMWHHTGEDIRKLRAAGVTRIIVRLPNSWEAPRQVRSFSAYAVLCVRYILFFYALGIREFQLDNEPQMDGAWPKKHEWNDGLNQESYDRYAWFIGETLKVIRGSVPGDVRIGLAPFAYSFNETSFEDAKKWQRACKNLSVDFLCVNVYWESQDGDEMLWPQFGGIPEVVHSIDEREQVIVEWGNSVGRRSNPPAPPQPVVEQCMVEQYPVYLRWLMQHDYITAACVFILPSGSDPWPPFRITLRVAEAMATAMPQEVGAGQSLVMGGGRQAV